MVEVERRAYADRAEYLGDPDFCKVPQNILLSDAYLKKRMNDYHSQKQVKCKLKAGNVQ